MKFFWIVVSFDLLKYKFSVSNNLDGLIQTKKEMHTVPKKNFLTL